ncbi:MAG: DUF721 domain-containing protein [Hyphomicrobiales bacterium]
MATAVGKHLRRLTRKAYESHGFAYAEILTQWTHIVGADLARVCRPQSIRWPKGFQNLEKGRQKLGGTLTILAAGASALELQHETPRILEKLNTYYGYGAITSIKIVQGHIELEDNGKTISSAPLSADKKATLNTQLGDIEDQPLRTALRKLGTGVHGRTGKKQK